MTDIPIPMKWDGESLTPINHRWAKEADKFFVVGTVYRIETVEERSTASHKHYHAQVRDAWLNLSDALSAEFDTPDKLRKFALIKAGFCDERVYPCSSKEEAHRLAAFIKPLDEYALVVPFDDVVKVWTAKSQSYKAMGKAEFQRSKDAVLEIVSAMIGAKPEDLGKAA